MAYRDPVLIASETPEDLQLGSVLRLPPGGHVVLRASEPPDGLRERLQRQHTGQFEWWPLEEGPDTWQILLVRRVGDSKHPRPFQDLLDREYVRILDQLRAVQSVLEQGRYREAVRRCGHLAARVRRHVGICREVVLPEAQRLLGGETRHLAELEEQHVALESLLDRLNQTSAGLTDAPDQAPEPLASLLRVLRSLVSAHAVNEERYLSPIIEHLLPEPERDVLVGACRAYV